MNQSQENNFDSSQLDEVLERFQLMLDNVDFTAQMQTLGVGRFQFARRKEAKRELSAMYVGLWKLALNSSFPHNADEVLDRFLYNVCNLKGKGKQRKAEDFALLCREYSNILKERGDTNFINVALLLCQHLGCDDQSSLRRISLQMALDMRAMYHHLFERLI